MTAVTDAVRAARDRVAGHVRVTPVFAARSRLTFKLEQHQVSGSFKARGAFNALLAARERGEVPDAGVVAASGGNHGLAVATAATRLGIPVRIFVPEAVSAVKLRLLRDTGADVTVAGALYADALAASAECTDAISVHAYDHPDTVAGQGTLGLELTDQVEFDTVLVAVGGGGLLAGTVAAVGERADVVAVEPERIPTLHDALAAGGPVDVRVGGVASDALGAKRIGALPYDVAAAAGVHSVLVTEDAIVAARAALWLDYRIAAEHAAATAYAAVHSGVYRPADGERVAVVVCGGNTDPGGL